MQRPKRAATEPCGGVHRSGFQCTAATPTSSGLLKQPDKQKLATFALHKPLDQGGAAREICGSKFHNAPWWGSVSKTAADETVSAKIVACVERCAVNVYSEPTLGDRKIGNGNWSLTLTGRYGNLLLRNESVLLKQPKKTSVRVAIRLRQRRLQAMVADHRYRLSEGGGFLRGNGLALRGMARPAAKPGVRGSVGCDTPSGNGSMPFHSPDDRGVPTPCSQPSGNSQQFALSTRYRRGLDR